MLIQSEYQQFVLQSCKISTSNFCISGNIVFFGYAGINRFGFFNYVHHTYKKSQLQLLQLQQVTTSTHHKCQQKLCLKERRKRWIFSLKFNTCILINTCRTFNFICFGRASYLYVILEMRLHSRWNFQEL